MDRLIITQITKTCAWKARSRSKGKNNKNCDHSCGLWYAIDLVPSYPHPILIQYYFFFLASKLSLVFMSLHATICTIIMPFLKLGNLEAIIQFSIITPFKQSKYDMVSQCWRIVPITVVQLQLFKQFGKLQWKSS